MIEKKNYFLIVSYINEILLYRKKLFKMTHFNDKVVEIDQGIIFRQIYL